CRRTRASNAPAGPRPSSSTHPAPGAEPLRRTGKSTPVKAVSEAVRMSSPMGLAKRVQVVGMGVDPKGSASLSRECKEPSGKPDGSPTIERPPLASGTDRAGGGADDDLACGRRDAGHEILEIHVDHVHGQAAARHTV